MAESSLSACMRMDTRGNMTCKTNCEHNGGSAGTTQGINVSDQPKSDPAWTQKEVFLHELDQEIVKAYPLHSMFNKSLPGVNLH